MRMTTRLPTTYGKLLSNCLLPERSATHEQQAKSNAKLTQRTRANATRRDPAPSLIPKSSAKLTQGKLWKKERLDPAAFQNFWVSATCRDPASSLSQSTVQLPEKLHHARIIDIIRWAKVLADSWIPNLTHRCPRRVSSRAKASVRSRTRGRLQRDLLTRPPPLHSSGRRRRREGGADQSTAASRSSPRTHN